MFELPIIERDEPMESLADAVEFNEVEKEGKKLYVGSLTYQVPLLIDKDTTEEVKKSFEEIAKNQIINQLRLDAILFLGMKE
jgi:hypothetical protein